MSDDARRGPGRPQTLSSEERCQRILAAALDVFLDGGFEFASMERIAQRCGMSKKTLYQSFTSKEALFAALIQSVEPINAVEVESGGTRSFQDEMIRLLLNMAAWILSPQQVVLTRFVIAETAKTPELAARFRELAVNRGRQCIRGVIDAHPIKAPPGLEDPDDLAIVLFGTAIGNLQLNALVGGDIAEALAPERLARRIRGTVLALFPES